MRKDFYPDETICAVHLSLRDNYRRLNKTVLDEKQKALLKEMWEMSKSIHYKATRMEKRLCKYRITIEGLGYDRRRNRRNNG